jgi:WD40 repeat protein
MHPFDNTAATTGDDNTLRFWDLENLTMTKSVPLTQIGGDKNKKPKKRNRRQGKRGGVATTGKHKPENCSRALSFCNVGENIAVGMNDGSFLVLRESDLSKVCQKKNPRRQQWIQDLKYSPLDDVLAVSTHDNFIDLWSYDAGAEDGNYAHFGQCDGHRSFVTHLDWSACGRYLQTNCGAYELLFWDTKDVEEGGQRKVKRMGRGGSELCDTEWSTQNCVIAFACTGIWYCPEGYTLNCVDKSKAGDLLAVGEDSSLIKLYKYPCVGTFVKSGRDPMLGGAQGNAAIGHGSHVSNLKFSFDDSRVVSVGGDDNATMVWKVVR